MSNTFQARPSTDWKPHRNYVETAINVNGLHPIQHADIIRERERKAAEIGISKFPVTRLPAGTPESFTNFIPKTTLTNGTGGKKRKQEISKEEEQQIAIDQLKSKEKSILNDSYNIELINEQTEAQPEEGEN